MPPIKEKPGILVVKGDVPDESVALYFARELIAEGGHIVAVTDLTHADEPSVQREGLPITISVDPIPISNN